MKLIICPHITIISLVLFLCSSYSDANPPRLVKVGAFNYYPGIFLDTDGIVKGFYVDALSEIAAKENIRFEYVYGSWSEGLERLKKGEVDLLTSVAYTAERAKYMDYCKTPLLTVWGELYALRTSEMDDILEAENKKIGVMRKDVNAAHFVELTTKFGIKCDFVEFESFDEVFKAIHDKKVDAGVASVTFGAARQTEYSLRSTGVIFNPFKIYFTTSKGKNRDILDLLNQYLQRWKHQENSIFNRARQNWSHGSIGKIAVIPDWFIRSLWILCGLVVLSIAFIISLRFKVKQATRQILQREEALRESEKKYRDLVEHTPDLITKIDKDGRLLFVNHASKMIFGLSPEESIGRIAFDFIDPRDKQKTIDDFGEWISAGEEGFKHDNRIISADGTVRDISWVISCQKNVHGEIIDISSIGRDITASKRAEEEKQKLEQQIQRSAKLESLGILAGGIAHDFNNLMGGVFGCIDLAISESQEEKVIHRLSKAMSTIDRARALTRQLLTFAKGGAPVQKVDNLFPFVEETALFALSGSNVACRTIVQKDLWPCNFDKNQIGQVIDNIIINAQQAMPSGGEILLSAENTVIKENGHSSLKKENYIKISVKDTGIGIPEELLNRIFDPFFTTKAKGHGLGLATCYSIIHRHGGYIEVESVPEKGSTFHIFLPASTETADSSKNSSVTVHKGSGTFLVMDDEEVIQDTIKDILESLGYSVVCKSNGKDAIDFFKSELVAMRLVSGMIFDLTVQGGMGGKEAAVEIRKLNKEVPIFIASGYAEDEVMKNPSGYGFTASICKPFRKAEIVEMLEKHLCGSS